MEVSSLTPWTIPQGAHVQPLYMAADQDGWQGEVICIHDGREFAVAKKDLVLA